MGWPFGSTSGDNGAVMTYLALGLNYRSAPSELLEEMTIPGETIPKVLADLAGHPVVNEVVVVSTCNRTEIYLHAERFHDGFRVGCDSLATVTGVPVPRFADHLYVHHGSEAVEHLFDVAAGLDSVVLGEHEILGQIRGAWDTARGEDTAGPLLGPLFEHAVRAGRRVRTETAIGQRTASLAHSAVELAHDRLHRLRERRVLLVGAGEVGAGVAEALARAGVDELVFCNRTLETAESLAARIGGSARPVSELAELVDDADVVISATGAPGYLIDAAMFTRPTARKLVMDLAIPRDVAPDVMTLDWIDLIVLADLQAFANANLAERQAAADDARALLDGEMERYRRTISTAEVEPLLGSLYRNAESLRLLETERIRRHHPTLSEAEWEAVDAATRAVVTRLLHGPSSSVRTAAGSHRGDRLAEAIRELFDLS